MFPSSLGLIIGFSEQRKSLRVSCCVCRASWRQRRPRRAPHLGALSASPGAATTPLVADWPLRWALSWSDWTGCCCCGLEAIADTGRTRSWCPARTTTCALLLYFTLDLKVLPFLSVSVIGLCYMQPFFKTAVCLVFKRSPLRLHISGLWYQIKIKKHWF